MYVLAVGGLALLAAVGRTLGTLAPERPTMLDRTAPPPPASPRPAALAKLEREVGLATETAFDVHYRLRPSVRRIAAARLRRHAVDLDTSAAAEDLLGPAAWEVARPDRPRPRVHEDPGLPLARVAEIVAALERL